MGVNPAFLTVDAIPAEASAAKGARTMAQEESNSPGIKLSELVDAFEFVSISEYEEHHAYICRQTGRIYFVSDSTDIEEDLPEDLTD